MYSAVSLAFTNKSRACGCRMKPGESGGGGEVGRVKTQRQTRAGKESVFACVGEERCQSERGTKTHKDTHIHTYTHTHTHTHTGEQQLVGGEERRTRQIARKSGIEQFWSAVATIMGGMYTPSTYMTLSYLTAPFGCSVLCQCHDNTQHRLEEQKERKMAWRGNGAGKTRGSSMEGR